MKNLQKYKRKIRIPALLIIINTILIAATLSDGPGGFFYIVQFVFAIILASARGKSKVKAFFQNLLTLGFLPFFSAIKGLIEAGRASVGELQKEQNALRDQIRQLDMDINNSRSALSELNGRLAVLDNEKGDF